ncbi:MAG: hypothetical protein ACXAEU_01075 [Candidatus Hodarchaeales archaeon]|jgi:hypothetical protein
MSSDEIRLIEEKAKEHEANFKWQKAADNWLKAARLSDKDKEIKFRFQACNALLKKEGVKDFFKNVDIFEESLISASTDEDKKEFGNKLVEYIDARLSLLMPKEEEDKLAVANERLGKTLEIVDRLDDARKAYREAGDIYLKVANANLLLQKKKSNKRAGNCLAGSCRTFRAAKEDEKAISSLEMLHNLTLKFANEDQNDTALHFLDFHDQLAEERDVLKLQLEIAGLLRKNERVKEDLGVSTRAGQLALKLKDNNAIDELTSKLIEKSSEYFESKRGLSYDYLTLANKLHVGIGKQLQVANLQADYAKRYYTNARGIFASQDRDRAWKLRDSSVKLFFESNDLKSAGQLDYELGTLAADDSNFDKAIELFQEADTAFKKGDLPENRLLVVETLRKYIPDLITRKKVNSEPFCNIGIQILQELDEFERLGDLYSEMGAASFEIKEYEQHLDSMHKTVDNYLKGNKEKARTFSSTIEARTESLTARNPIQSLQLLDLHAKLFKSVDDVKPAIYFAMKMAKLLIEAKQYQVAVSSTEKAYNLSNDSRMTYWASANNLFDVRVYQTALKLFTKTKDDLTSKKDVEGSRKLAKELEEIATREAKSIEKEKLGLKKDYIDLAFSVYEALSLSGEKGDLYLAEAKRHFEKKVYDKTLQNYNAAATVYLERDHSAATNVAEMLLTDGQRLLDEKKIEEADLFFGMAGRIHGDLKDSINQARVYAAQGIGLLSKKRFEEGLAAIENSTKTFFDDNKHVKAGEVYQQAGQTLLSTDREDLALDTFIKANNAFYGVKDKKKVITLGKIVEGFMVNIAKSRRKKELYDRYFEVVKSIYTKLDLQEQLGDLYVSATRRALDLKTSREEATELSQQAASHYGTEYSHKIQPIIDVFVEYTKKYLEEQEYVKSAELSEQAVDMLLDAGKDGEAADLAASQSIYLIKNGAVDPGIGVLEKAASLYEMVDKPLKVGETLFEGAKVLADRDQFASSLANISRAVSIYEEYDDFDKIKDIANQCVMIAEDMTSKHNDRAAKLYLDHSAELYSLPGMSVDHTAEAIYTDYTDKLLDTMSTSITQYSKKRRKRKRKRKRKTED